MRPQVADRGRQYLRIGSELLKHAQFVDQRHNRHGLSRLRLFQHVLEHLRAAIRLVFEGRVGRIQKQHGGNAGWLEILRAIRQNARRQGLRRGLICAGRREGGNLLLLSVLFDGKVFRLQSCDGMALLVCHHNIHDYQTRVGTDGDGRNFGQGLLRTKGDRAAQVQK